MKKLLIFALSVWSLTVIAAGGGDYKPNDPANLQGDNKLSLQNGARLYMGYCMGCHSLKFQRYNRMAADLGIPEDVLIDNFIFDDSKPGDHMTNAMPSEYAENWFGVVPPDLSLVARSRGADWLYNYLRAFYRDPNRPYGVNNSVFKDVGMPHVLESLQGVQVLNDEGDLELVSEGSMTTAEFDESMRDLVNFIDYVGEPIKQTRKSMGLWILIFIGVFFVFAYLLKQEYWRDIH